MCMKKERDYIARLVVYGLQGMKNKDYKRLLTWLDKRYEEAQKPNYTTDYSNKYVAKLMK